MTIQSIRRRLLASLITTIIFLWLITALFVYQVASHEVEEIYDATLAQESRILATLMIHEIEEDEEVKETLQKLVAEAGEDVATRSSKFMEILREFQSHESESEKDYLTLVPRDLVEGHRYESKIAFLIKGVNGKTYLRSNLPASFNDFKIGYNNFVVEDKAWRMFGLKESSGQFNVLVGELLSVREEIESEIVFNSLWPIIIALPLLGFIIWMMVGNGLKPLSTIADKVENRDPNSLDPISTEDVPSEVVPMVESLNHLFLKVHSALENERRFTADAAHELRTPLAALKTLAQAKSLSTEQAHKGFLDQVIRGVDRATHLLEQLLTLARMDSQSFDESHTHQVDLQQEAINVIAAIAGLALEKDIEISYDGPNDMVVVPGFSPAIQILLRNIIDNAIRYTPNNGEVTVKLVEQDSGARLEVHDTGPGIPESQQQGLYQRFRRGEDTKIQGSGLGLAIVKRIIDLHHATIEMENRENHGGLTVSVNFPGALTH
ncbi:MAG: ATP-binding protein [Candidatus Thiodiazotropha weberae]|nr:ATP-binding protein [Candidatus Thiodiazotropha lotti]MCG7986474.1 ATP-binding protein [Candidatus Thiodiazotropha lotti]MCG8010220.1 ATP-binding protein [Candidatus Thiodiazotropha lotti]MCG8018975.1 ATP-binding protein [Candidatus Thiodiazotropha lotti]MCW4206134.1 ATP-binding protein [Candidatus Thiodiazotropha lotti]